MIFLEIKLQKQFIQYSTDCLREDVNDSKV